MAEGRIEIDPGKIEKISIIINNQKVKRGKIKF